MEDLYCAETAISEGPIAIDDPCLLQDTRVMDNLRQLEQSYIPTQNYFKFIQKDLQPYMRKVVTTWMLEVCEEQSCEDQVFSVAVNFLDRFLCTCVVQRTQLQLVGAVCLLLASKIRQCRHLSIELLAYYTDNSVALEEIRQWELLLVSKLGWDLCPVTACDFLDHLLQRVPLLQQQESVSPGENLVRRHASTFVALAATESDFVQTEPSAIAVASIVAAVRGLRGAEWQAVLSTLAGAVQLDAGALVGVVEAIEVVVQRETAVLPAHLVQQQSQQQPSTPTTKQAPPPPMEFYDGNETPTDVSDIFF